MSHRCAWCGKQIADEDNIEPVGAVSDGICEKCQETFFPKPKLTIPSDAYIRLAAEKPGYVN